MSIRMIGTTLLAAAGVCGSAAAVWSHTRDAHAVEARDNSRGARFSRHERGQSNFARDFMPHKRRGGAQGGARAWDDRGR
jgi:hypothetical protein